MGSGVVLDETHVLTNQHVVGDAGQILLTLADGQVVHGTVVGGDEETDIAVVRVEGHTLAPAEFGDSGTLQVGQPVLAIGNPLGLAGGPTVTSGVVSSLNRSLNRPNGGLHVIQTDAAVNPGSSGGPLVDLEGRVIAITTATIPYAEAIGFALPANDALEVARQIQEHGHVRRAWLGVVGHDVEPRLVRRFGLKTPEGVFVAEVTADGPAAAAGLQPGDVLLSINGEAVTSVTDLVDMLRRKTVGDPIELAVNRRGKALTLSVALGIRPF
jgi:S1-C subfamily serine protease